MNFALFMLSFGHAVWTFRSALGPVAVVLYVRSGYGPSSSNHYVD